MLLGSQKATSKLTEAMASEVIFRLSEGGKLKELSAEYGVSKSVISRIKNGLAWSHLARPTQLNQAPLLSPIDVLFANCAPEPNTGCWLWLGYVNNKGYGNIKLNGRPELTHRRAYRLKHGGIPEGLWILHKCDTPSCINPDHLYAGTREQNIADMISRNRQNNWNGRLAGEANPNAILTGDEVREIRSITGVSSKRLGLLYGVGFSTISNIKLGRTWSSLK